MKRILRLLVFIIVPIIALCLFTQSASAIEWQDIANRKVAWDAVQAAAASKTIVYRLYRAEPTNINNPIFLAEVSALTYTVTIPAEVGVYYVGVSAVLKYNDAANTTEESLINWSNVDNPAGSTPVPFGWKQLFPPLGLSAVVP